MTATGWPRDREGVFISAVEDRRRLLWFGLGFTPVADWFFLHLALGAGVGATIYVTVLFAAWFAAGRPQGPETDLLLVLRKVFGYLQAKIARHGLRG